MCFLYRGLCPEADIDPVITNPASEPEIKTKRFCLFVLGSAHVKVRFCPRSYLVTSPPT